VIGTPAYMPPEQARGRIEEIGPAADVYAIGAMLYHVLSGRMPYTRPSDRMSPRTVLALVTQGPPPALASVAPTSPPELVAIVEKAMAREIADRYPDMTAVARDLRAFLENRVVAAYETGAWAELKKWVKRNRALAAAFLLVGVVLVAATVTTTRLYLRAEEETTRANQQLAIREEVLDLVRKLFKTAEGDPVVGRRLTVAEILEKASEELDEDRIEDPETRAELARLVGNAFTDLGLAVRGEEILENARRDALAHLEPSSRLLLKLTDGLLHALMQNERPRERLVALNEWIGETLDAHYPVDDPFAVDTRFHVVEHFVQSFSPGEALELLDRQIPRLVGGLPRTHPKFIVLAVGRDTMLSSLGRHAEGMAILEEELRIQREVLGPKHPDLLELRFSIVDSSLFGGGVEAQKQGRLLVEEMRDALGAHHSLTLSSAARLVESFDAKGDEPTIELIRSIVTDPAARDLGSAAMVRAYGALARVSSGDARNAALEQAQELAESLETELGLGNSRARKAVGALAALLEAVGLQERAEVYRRSVVEHLEAKWGHARRTLAARLSLAKNLMAQGELDEAEELLTGNADMLEDGSSGMRALLQVTNLLTLADLDRLGLDDGSCIDWLKEAIRVAIPKLGEFHIATIGAQLRLSGEYNREGQGRLGAELAMELADRVAGVHGPRSDEYRMCLSSALFGYIGSGQLARAAEAARRLDTALVPTALDHADMLDSIAVALSITGNGEEALGYARRAVDASRPDDRWTPGRFQTLIDICLELDRLDEARVWYRGLLALPDFEMSEGFVDTERLEGE